MSLSETVMTMVMTKLFRLIPWKEEDPMKVEQGLGGWDFLGCATSAPSAPTMHHCRVRQAQSDREKPL